MIVHRWFKEVFHDEIYKPVKKLGTLKTVIDLGSTTGEFSLWVYPQAEKIFAIEPHWGAFNHLAENVRDFPKIIPFFLAVAGENGHRGVYNEEIGASSIAIPNDVGMVNVVKAQTLATFMNENNIDIVDCLKIDVESAEKEIFEAEDFKDVASRIKYIIGEDHQDALDKILPNLGFNYKRPSGHNFIARRKK